MLKSNIIFANYSNSNYYNTSIIIIRIARTVLTDKIFIWWLAEEETVWIKERSQRKLIFNIHGTTEISPTF